MTEAEWLTGADPMPMLKLFKGKATDRKLRLLYCAWGRDGWAELTDERSRAAIRAAELFADGAADAAQLRDAYCAAWEPVRNTGPYVVRIAVTAAGKCFAEDLMGL